MNTLTAGDYVRLNSEVRIICGLREVASFPAGSEGRIKYAVASDAGFVEISGSSFFVHANEVSESISTPSTL